ncbi:cell envelope integrity protein CreD [Jannaschia marina]|uniref:cell envelope integrity protein CreD n=1 Tax=Jannaschia marina TaxID=2741674 RepID=UPI0015C7E23B|nr:cell envelope integrity protein CreD [Jannaschia marina]
MLSPGFRFLVVGLLALLMFIPQFFAGSIVQDRARYADQVAREIGQEWGGPQQLSGPFLIVPVEATEYRTVYRDVPVPAAEADDPNAESAGDAPTRRERYREAHVVRREPVVLLPESFDALIETESDIRKRSIFEVPVYSAEVGLTTGFDPARAATALAEGERLVWDEAVIRLRLSANAALRGDTTLAGPDGPLDLRPYASDHWGGIEADVGALSDPTTFTARFMLNGSQRIDVVPVGRTSDVRMAGDWPDPAFRGAFLPDSHDVTETGYAATWSVPHLARALPQVSRGSDLPNGTQAFGTGFVQVNDFYQKAWRAGRYGILFIALTFLTVLLLDRKDRPTHPVQYLLIGLAQSTFVLLMVAYAEQFGFTAAYVGSAAATIALLTLFGATGLRMGRRTPVLAALLTVLYAVLYMILRSTDLALLAGATLAFGALALTIVLTRNEEWYGASGPGQGPFRRTRPDQAKAASSAISTMSPKEV